MKVYAQNNPDGGNNWRRNHRPSGGKKADFDFPIDLKKGPSTYIDAAIANLFYWNNIIHDLFYVYGFNEVSGNFQDNNLGRGGKGGDAVIANAQDGSGKLQFILILGTNNANFATPPDGKNGRMRMYVWTQTTPDRDGDLEAGIIIHEYAHGISTRLTGGPANSGCLGWGEAGGMGEGWGDFFATILRMDSNSTRDDVYSMGDYSNGGKGIRNYPYSTNNKTNPSTYSFIRKPTYWGVHAKGEVWAEILYEYFWNLVEKHGWEDDWFNVPLANATISTPYPIAGNKLALRLVVDGLKLQPCSPTFVDARDAILLADTTNTGGDNQCEIWKAFAKRGLGVDAEPNGLEDFGLPADCKSEE
jgi:extracellular elastinolytic metalloproteinase